MSNALSVIVLAAGQGTRMRSALPKVLHRVADRPLLEHAVDAARALAPAAVHVVYGHGGEQVPEQLAHLGVTWTRQEQQLGTGHAVSQAMPAVPDGHTALVLYGDVPLITPQTLTRLVEAAGGEGFALLTARVADPTGYGRIVRDDSGAVQAIVEHKDASAAQRAIDEINTGMLAAPAGALRRWLAAVGNDNAQGEYYLTDIVALAVRDGVAVASVLAESEEEILGVNDRVQLAEAERAYQRRQALALMRDGVTLRDPERFDLRGRLTAGRDVVIDANVLIEGEVTLGDGVSVGPNTVLRNVTVADGVRIGPMCVLEDAEIGAGGVIGPFARIRPGTRLAPGVHVGNFVEIKKATVGEGSKINHLSYVGDARVGARVNIGAGTITCNYDGANKHTTIIGDEAFIGSDTQLVAPVEIGAGATIGAGSTITRDAPPGELTLSRSAQKSLAGWTRPRKKQQ